MIDREMVLGDLMSRIRPGSFGAACSSFGSFRGKALALGDIVYELYVSGPFGMYGDEMWCFNGRIYERTDPDFFRWVLLELLKRAGVDANVRVYSKELIEHAKLAVKMECELKPKFHIRAFANGVADLKTGQLMPYSPQWHVLYEHDYSFDAEADCPIWKRFLKTILPETNSRAILQMFMGLMTLERSEVNVPLCLAMYGNSVYGKSVVNELIRNLCGAENIGNMGIGLILKEGDSGLRNRTLLMGKYVNICSQLEETEILKHDTDFVKFIKGSGVRARFTRGIEFTLSNVPYLIFNLDKYLTDDDKGSGVFRRFVYLVFNEYIPDKEANLSIGEELRNELSGILNWCIRGARYARLHHYRFPSSENNERERILSMGAKDSVKAWFMFTLASSTSRKHGEEYRWAKVKHIYTHYKKFCEKNGFEFVSQLVFGRKLNNYGFVGGNRRRMSTGVEVRIYGFSEDKELYESVDLNSWRSEADAEFADITDV